jgi:hypothetical protein
MLMVWLVAGCSTLVRPADVPPVPRPCGQVYSAQLCLAMTDEAASRSGRTRDDVVAIDVVDFPTTQGGVLITRSGGGFNVRLNFKDGTAGDEPMCVGVGSGAACMDVPRLEARTSVGDGGGYHDVPCADDAPPGTCGKPLPTFEPAALAAARPLSLATFQVPIDHRGAYEVPLGEALLPNGIVSVATFAFVDDWPFDVSLKDGVATIRLRSLEPDGKPFENYHEHGWRPGVERSEAILVFEILWSKPGAVLKIRDVVVR